jgi:ferritin-like metal-binding protein YciE
MGIFTSERFNTLNDLFLHELKDLYDAEHQLTEALPQMADAAASSDLRTAFNSHLLETREHINRLKQVFQRIGQEPERQTCPAMKGLVKEGSEAISATGDAKVKDAALIASAQRVEHYEMAGYGTLRTFARQLGLNDIASLLQKTLDEEGAADKKLTRIAESHINVEASQGVGKA